MKGRGIHEGYGKGSDIRQKCFLNTIEKVQIRVQLGVNPEKGSGGVGETLLESIVTANDPSIREIGSQRRRICRGIYLFSQPDLSQSWR